jgi:hypothetical protein
MDLRHIDTQNPTPQKGLVPQNFLHALKSQTIKETLLRPLHLTSHDQMITPIPFPKWL